MKRRTIATVAAIAAIAGLSACAANKERPENYVDEKAPAATVVGEAETCIQVTRIRNSQVRSDNTIDFEMNGGKVYRNTLPYGCSGLGFEKAFAYKTSLSQLCSTDIIHVIDSSGDRRGASCGLGPFVPVEYDKDDAQ